MKQFQMFAALFFALSLSAWLGRAELHTDDTGILIGLIGLGGLLLSMVEPRRPWMWGVIVPAGVIFVEVWNYSSGRNNPHLGGVAGLIGIAAVTIATASAGAYLGAFIRRSVVQA
jgi:hypothetical protein